MAVIRFGRKSGTYPEFSNFYRRGFRFREWYVPHGESAFQLMKAPRIAEQFLNLNPRDAKRLGRQVLMDKDFEKKKFGYMRELVYEKFSQNEDLKRLLLDTGNDFIVEDTTGWHDCIWGCCLCGTSRCDKLALNGLGTALMLARQKIRGDKDTILEFSFKGEPCTFSLNMLVEGIDSGNQEALKAMDAICKRAR